MQNTFPHFQETCLTNFVGFLRLRSVSTLVLEGHLPGYIRENLTESESYDLRLSTLYPNLPTTCYSSHKLIL
jgi:hypothetical protein